MIFKIKGKALVSIYWEDECDCCGQMTEKEDQDVAFINREVSVSSKYYAETYFETGDKIVLDQLLRCKGEIVYFEHWSETPEIRPLADDELMRRQGYKELF